MSRRPAPPSVPLALVVTLVAAPAARGEPTEHYSVRAELGGELDTNAHRTETIDGVGLSPVVSPVARAVVSGAINDVVGDRNQVALSATIATKLFTNPEARSEDVAVVDASALWRKPLNERWSVAATGGYYDAFQRDLPSDDEGVFDRRDFRSLTPTLRLSRAFSPAFDAGVGAGYRQFVFKPDHTYDFQAPTAVLDARWARETADGAADWEVAFRAGYEHRMFLGRQLVDTTATCAVPGACLPTTGPERRRDDFLTSALDISRTGRLLVGAGYGLQINLSNSYGESVLRHVITTRFAAALPFDFYLAARLEILIARYADQLFLAPAMAGRPYATIDDENRNSARIELSRNLSDRLQLIARYTYYSNELARSDVSYRRQVALVSLSFSLEN